MIKWTDDNGEESFICSENDLDDAIEFHKTGDDPPTSSASSVFSSRSSRSKITLVVEVNGENYVDVRGGRASRFWVVRDRRESGGRARSA